jgi:hypothetical protein
MPKSDRNPLVHGSNLEQKENHRTKYRDVESKKYLSEIKTEYDKWRSANFQLVGPTSTPTVNMGTTETQSTQREKKRLTQAYCLICQYAWVKAKTLIFLT